MNILLLGKDGQVGWELQRSLAPLGEVDMYGRSDADLEDAESLRRCVRKHRPDVIVNAAAYTGVDKAETESDKAQRVNADAAGVLAEEAARCNAWLVHYSTDYVFSGKSNTPYKESDQTAPLSVYGRTKCIGEEMIRSCHGRHLIVRTSWVYAARGSNFAKTMLRLAHERNQLKVVADQYGAPTSAELIADITALMLYRIFQNKESASALAGTYHLTAGGHTSWHGYAQYVLELALAGGASLKCSPDAVEPLPTSAYPLPAERPQNSRLDTTKLTNVFNVHLPHWRHHVQRLMAELKAQ